MSSTRSSLSQIPKQMLTRMRRRRCSPGRSRTRWPSSSASASTASCGSGTTGIKASAGDTRSAHGADFRFLAEGAWGERRSNPGRLDGSGYGSLDGGSPMCVPRVAPAQHVVKCRFQGTGDRPNLTAADGVFVDGDDRRYFGGGATGKDLVGEIQLGAIDVTLDDLQPEDLAGEDDQGVASDALEDSAADVRRNDRIARDKHHAGAGTLGNFSEVIEEDRGVITVVPRLHAGELAIPVVGEILDPGRHDVLGDTTPGAHSCRLGQSRFEVGLHRRGVNQERGLLAELGKALT